MQIRFGLMLQELTFPEFVPEVEHTFGESGFLAWAEQQLGLQYTERQQHLRQEQYRQVLAAFLLTAPDAFFARSFKADSLATATTLLDMRDELLLSGWDFVAADDCPERLKVLSQIEILQRSGQIAALEKGFADRFLQMERAIQLRPLPVEELWLNEPLELQPPHWARLWLYLAAQGVILHQINIEKPHIDAAAAQTDLEVFQQRILQPNIYRPQPLRGDGSLMIFQAARQSDAAFFLAKLRQANPQIAPVCLVDKKNSLGLDIAMIREGQPSLGIASASLARPTLQILKLAAAFIWRPIDPYKLLEFVSLPNKPMHEGLARCIADVMARKPGLFSSAWNSAIANFFEQQRAKIAAQPERAKELRQELRTAENQYNFWIARRKRYDSQRERVPAKACIEIFEYIQEWADEQIEAQKERAKKIEERIEKWRLKDETLTEERLNNLRGQIEDAQQAQIPLANLFNQASRIAQVLNTLPKEAAVLSPLELERIIRNLEEPAPLALRLKEVGHWAYFTHSSAISESTDTLLWWDFVQSEHIGLFNRWYFNEQEYLKRNNMLPESPQIQQQRLLWQARRPIAAARNRLILVSPSSKAGQTTEPHPFWSDLQSIWGDDLKRICYQIQRGCLSDSPPPQGHDWLSQFFILPEYEPLPLISQNPVKSYLQLENAENIDWKREEESFTGIDALLYTPYDWVFKHKIDLRKSSILSVSSDEAVKGNLAHALLNQLFELLKDAAVSWTPTFTENWFNNHINDYIESEGATLQLYGKEAERAAFVSELRTATIALVDAIGQNNWKIVGSEVELLGELGGQPLKGIADLVLERGRERCVVDIKWSNGSKYLKRFESFEDLQLVIYSGLACEQTDWAHTAYYSLRDAKFVARNNRAFRQAIFDNQQANLDFKVVHQSIWNKIEATYQWRMQQLKAGVVALNENHPQDDSTPEVLNVGDFSQLLETFNSQKGKYSIYKNLLSL
jgi:hypothetical protein